MSEGIDPRVFDRPPHPADVDEHGRVRDDRERGTGGDSASQPWPPPSGGPLPPADSLPPDLNVQTAHDEIDAWAHEHDQATETLARLRVQLAGDADTEGAEVAYLWERTRARRKARASPTERGRRTAQDIDEEVTEALLNSGVLQEKQRLEAAVEVALGRLFRARDNQTRLQQYVRSLPREERP